VPPCRFLASEIDVGLGDGQDRARRVAEHVLADGAQDPRYPVARRQDKELGVLCLGDVDQGASGQVRDRDEPVFHALGRVAERVADGLTEQVVGDGPVVGAGEAGGSWLDGGRPAPFGGVGHDGAAGRVHRAGRDRDRERAGAG
jgi:hypothetical protein